MKKIFAFLIGIIILITMSSCLTSMIMAATESHPLEELKNDNGKTDKDHPCIAVLKLKVIDHNAGDDFSANVRLPHLFFQKIGDWGQIEFFA